MGTKANWSGGYGRNRHFAKNLHQPPPGDQSWEGDLPASADQERRQVAFSVGDRVAHEDDGQGQVIDVLGVPRDWIAVFLDSGITKTYASWNPKCHKV